MSTPGPQDEDRTVIVGGAGSGDAGADDRTVIVGAAAAPDHEPAREPARAGMSHNALPIGTKLGEFEITGLVGEGGFGIVYLAYDHSLEREVAVKEYMPSELAHREGGFSVVVRSQRHAETFAAGMRSFINEARLLAQFDHPSLLKVYRYWQENGTAYMAMPFYRGKTLKQALQEHGAAPDEAWLKSLLAQLLDALEIIHSRTPPVLHRDIAPDNILMLPDETPLLLDFGAARRVIGDMTQALTVILKPGYAPIEQYAEVPNMKQGPWTDLYALTSVVYYAITGAAPVPAVARVMSDPLVPLAQSAAGRYSDAFLRAIDNALAVKPEERPQNIAQFREALGIAPREPVTRFRSAGETIMPASAALGAATIASPATAASAAAVPVAAPKRTRALAIGGGVLAVLVIAGIVAWVAFDEPLSPARTADVSAAKGDSAADASAELKHRLGAFDCALVQATMNDGTATLRGFVATEADLSRLNSDLTSVTGVRKVDASAVKVYPRPYCAAASTLAPYAGDAASGPHVALKGGTDKAFEGDKLVAEIAAPKFDAYVYVDLYEPDGNVVHLLPNAKDNRNQIKSGQRMTVGDDPIFGMEWDVVPPFGKHMLSVVATRTPLFDRTRPPVEESFGYLRALRDATAAKSAADVAASYTVIEVAPKR